MTWNDLKLNLLSEAIGILVTVILVDRLIEAREQRKWKPARQVFLAHIALLESRLSVALNDWLQSLTTSWEENRFGWEHVWSDVAKRTKDREVLTALDAFRQGLGRSAQRADWASKLNAALASFFLPRPLSASAGWRQFAQASQDVRRELTDVVGSYSAFLDPDLALMLVQISRSLTVLCSIEERWETYFEMQDKDRRKAANVSSTHREFERIVAMALTNLIAQSSLLGSYLTRHRQTLTFEAQVNPYVV